MDPIILKQRKFYNQHKTLDINWLNRYIGDMLIYSTLMMSI